MIHVTTICPDLDTARSLARANITPAIVSLFHWQGAVGEETEAQITFKASAATASDLVAPIAETHPCDLPVITWEEVAPPPAAAGWLAGETR
jgi:periplasmic divalent cation tolerance protein